MDTEYNPEINVFSTTLSSREGTKRQVKWNIYKNCMNLSWNDYQVPQKITFWLSVAKQHGWMLPKAIVQQEQAMPAMFYKAKQFRSILTLWASWVQSHNCHHICVPSTVFWSCMISRGLVQVWAMEGVHLGLTRIMKLSLLRRWQYWDPYNHTFSVVTSSCSCRSSLWQSYLKHVCFNHRYQLRNLIHR